MAELAAQIPAAGGRRRAGATFERQYRQCNKQGCRRWHGPYWYAYWKEGGRLRSAYVGSNERLAAVLAAQRGGAQ